MLPCRKRKATTSKHSVEVKTGAKTADDAFSVQPAEQRSSKKSKTDGTDVVMQEDRATSPQEPLVAEESRKTAKLLHGDETKKTPGQVAAAFRWNQKLKELKAYEAEHGDCLVPQNYSANPPLGSWVSKQRKNYKRLKNGRQSSITKGQIEKLETINGWEWVARGRHRKNQSIWNLRLFELQKYKQEHGHLHVPRKYQKSPQLGTWVHNQREQYKLLKNGRPSAMTEDRIKKLEAIDGWVWTIFECGNWNVRFSELQKYKQEHGDCLVPKRYPANPQLGAWVNRKREQYKLLKEGKMSHMTQDHIDSLEELGFVWLLPEIRAQQDEKCNTAVQLAVKKKLEESHIASDILSSAIAASNPEAAAVAAVAAVSSANSAEVGREITYFADVDDTKNSLMKSIASDEEELFAYVLRCVITNKTPGIH